MPAVELARRTDIELVKTGSWATMTGSWNPTPEDLASAVEAQSCPSVRRPIVKLGHVDSRFDGEPALGWFENLRIADGGATLIGDQVTLPWLHSVQAAAYPSRSVEGNYNHTCASGHKHKFVLTAVALLGVTPPAVKTIRNLNDLPTMLGVAAGEQDVPEGAARVQVTILAAEVLEHTGAMVALIPTAEDAQRLVVEGGLPLEEMHLTLAYLGEAADLGAQGQQDVIDAVSRAANGLPQLNADVFSAAVFNPGDVNDRDPCLVYLVSGDPVDAVHDLVDEAMFDVMWPHPSPIPPQHRPWFAHITGIYTGDLARIGDLATRMGPIRFDRIRLAFAGDIIDIPLIPPGENGAVAAAAGEDIRARIAGLREARNDRKAVSAAGQEPAVDPDASPETPTEPATVRPAPTDPSAPTPAEPAAPILPAAEPEPVNTDPKEDLVSTDLSAFRSRLGLDDTADESAITAAIDALKVKAETPAVPTQEMVAASAAATEKATQAEAEKDELRKEVQVLASQMTQVTAELSAAKAVQAGTVKAGVFDAAIKDGKLKPADREQWEKDYDEAPGAITRVLASIAPGTAVPVMASGSIGSPDPAGPDSEWDDIVSRLDAPKAV